MFCFVDPEIVPNGDIFSKQEWGGNIEGTWNYMEVATGSLMTQSAV